jgi:Uncharacterized protein conserved in bacteria (DUF2090)
MSITSPITGSVTSDSRRSCLSIHVVPIPSARAANAPPRLKIVAGHGRICRWSIATMSLSRRWPLLPQFSTACWRPDEQFGAAILGDAGRSGYLTCAPAEKSGQEEFDFEYGEDFAKHIEAINPTFCKVLVRYNPESDTRLNQRQAARLQRLSDYLHAHDRKSMFELLVPAMPEQSNQVGGDRQRYDHERRPALMVQAIREL